MIPLFIASMIDVGIAQHNNAHVLKMGAWVILLAIVGLSFSLLAQYFAAYSAVGASCKLRSSLFAHIQSFSYKDLDKIGTSTLLNRMTADVNQVQTGINMTLRLLLRSPFVVAGAAIMAFTVDAKSSAIFLATIPVLIIIIYILMRLTLPRQKRVQAQLDNVTQSARENITGVRVLRSFNLQQKEEHEFKEKTTLHSRLQMQTGHITTLMNPLTTLVVNIALVILLWTGAIQVNTGVISTGSVIALVNYLSQILIELVKMANLIVILTKSIASAKRIQDIFSITPTQKQASSTVELRQTTSPIVDFSKVSFQYSNTSGYALQDISFQANRGQSIGVIGGTASGKSTLLQLIPRLYDATAGTVSVFGADVLQQNISELRSNVGYVAQGAVPIKGSIRENLLWGNQQADDTLLWKALETAQAAEFVQKKSKGLDEELNSRGSNLSGGQKQRLMIARALVKQPAILLLDDSASALDYATDAALRKSIRTMENAPTVFIASQRASAVRFCDIILVLEDGKLIASGKHENLVNECELYRETYYLQYPKEG